MANVYARISVCGGQRIFQRTLKVAVTLRISVRGGDALSHVNLTGRASPLGTRELCLRRTQGSAIHPVF